MFIKYRSKLSFFCAFLWLFCALMPANATDKFNDAARGLPDRIGTFRASGAPRLIEALGLNALSGATREYQSAQGEKVKVTFLKMRSDSNAYALLTSLLYKHISDAVPEFIGNAQPEKINTGEIGTASVVSPGSVAFYKGANFVAVNSSTEQHAQNGTPLVFSRLFAQTLESEAREIPVLVKHLPDWEMAQARAAYAINIASLKNLLQDEPVLNAINFIDGTEAVVAPYESSQLAIIEYATPQIAASNDANIIEEIRKLKAENQSVPSAYRRVGNYSVFVFNSPDAITAENLINQVHYEQVVQWLGDNPRALQRAQREYAATTAGLILAVLKASGLALILCLGTGGIFGSIIFLRRRAHQTATAAYSDAGGLMRLNIDDMTAQTNPSRLLKKPSN